MSSGRRCRNRHGRYANFMRVHLFSAIAALRLGMDRLTQKEHVTIDRILAYGGLFKTPLVGQKNVCRSTECSRLGHVYGW
ncbi:FGGY-family carbohydrate kinase [Paenibacillus luteus]|uniref:FGGY-family carbohydrate kinase n=1 Tax=Paenibacillus luteus TaxID=2545753 RepID=UPI001F4FC7B8|nr:FGGY-family carbohydrate kinase [Paenibacillus luteus]